MSDVPSTGHLQGCEGGTVSVPTKYFLLIKDLFTAARKSTLWFVHQL